MKLETPTLILEGLFEKLESEGLFVDSMATDHTEDIFVDYLLEEKGLNRIVIKVYHNQMTRDETKQIFKSVLNGFGFDIKIDDDIIADKYWIGYRMEFHKKPSTIAKGPILNEVITK